MASMRPTPVENSYEFDEIVDKAIQRAETWMAVEDDSSGKEAKSTQQLAALVHDENGIDFTMGFVDRVARPEDNTVAAKQLKNIFGRQDKLPDFIGAVDKGLIGAGAFVGPLVPAVVMPLARKRMRQMVGHLVLDAEGKALNKRLEEAADEGFTLNLNLLGEAVLGEAEAKDRLESTRLFLQNPRVSYVSIKASSVCAQLNPWDIEGNTERLKDRLRPLYREALKRSPHSFINLDMEEYKDLHLTIKLFKELLMEEEFLNLEAGIVLQAYLPDTYDALVDLAAFAAERRARGGAKIKIRLVKGANLSMERVDAEMHHWEQTPYGTKAEVDANYLRLVDYILQPEHADNVRIGVASHNLYTVAAAVELAEKRGVQEQLDIEMLQGMAPSQARAVKEVVGSIILYTPVVHAEDFDVAVSYLVRRLEENGESQNFLYALFAPDIEAPDGLTPMEDQRERFKEAAADRWATFAGARRTQDRLREAELELGRMSESRPGHFVGEPDTDPSLPANRQWARELLARTPGEAVSALVTDPADIDAIVQTAAALGEDWGAQSGAARAHVLDAIGDALANARGDLITAMTHESGKTVAEADPEVSEGIDFCTYYAESARTIDRSSSVFTPHRVVLVTPPWNFPMAIPTGGMMAALAAGAAVIIKPAPQVLRIAEVLVDAIRSALVEQGQNPDLVQLVNADEEDAGKALVSHEKIDHVILTGASETAKLFRSWRPEMNISAETSGKNAIIVTPAADPDVAVDHVYNSAFGHAGQKCSAASLVILVGSVGESERFLNQLVDAVKTLHVGVGADISTKMNGIIEPPGEKLERGLTKLEAGEKWLVEPKKLNDEGTLWSPGIRDNVQPGSWFHVTECFGPVMGIMYADSLEEAIELQNGTGFGLTGGLHSLDKDEIDYWKEHVEVGNAYINRGITGAIVERQSFGGWKNSAVGVGAKAGGPNYVALFGTWEDGDLTLAPRTTLEAKITRELTHMLRSEELQQSEKDFLEAAAHLDARAWREEFGVEHDRTALVAESNVFRYRPLLTPLPVRVGFGAGLKEIFRYQLASLITGTAVEFTANEEVAAHLGLPITVMSDHEFAEKIRSSASIRVRALGQVDPELYSAAAESGSYVIDAPVLADGRRELTYLLLEQAISHTMHRFGILQKY